MGEAAAEGKGAGAVSAGSELPADRAFVLQLTGETPCSLDTFAGRVEHLLSGRRLRFETSEEFFVIIGQLLKQLR